MRKKIKQVLCMFSALVVMICCAVPAFADDTVTEHDLSSVKWNLVNSSSDIPHYDDLYNRYQRMISSFPEYKSDNYIAIYGKKSDKWYVATFIFFPPDNTVFYDFSCNKFMFKTLKYSAQSFQYVYDLQGNYSTNMGLQCVNNTAFDFKDYDLSSCQVYIHTKLYDWSNPDKDVTPADPTAVPAPFTVTYSPVLKLNLKRKTPDYETKSIDVTLTLNHDYLDWYIRRYAEMLGDKEVGTYDSASIKMILDTILNTLDVAKDFDLTGCGKSKCIYFISLFDPSQSVKKVTDNSVYTYLSQQRYSIVDKVVDGVDGSTSTATYANGLYPYFTVDFKDYFKHSMQSDIVAENCSYKKYQEVIKDLPTYKFSIPLENINSDKFEVISVLNSILTCETKFITKSDKSVFTKSFESTYNYDDGIRGVNFNNLDYVNVDRWETDDTPYSDYFNQSDIYTVYSDKFSFDSYPKYVPLKDGKGNDIDMIKTNPFEFSKNPVSPGTFQSVNKDGTFSEERTEEEQKKHDKDTTFSKNFANVDYSDFSSIFSTSSSYFEFLTASIRILPDWFIATFTAWFVTFLTLALIKYVIQ
ncbi:hypothetical protein [Ruminococcus sp.]|uniref:hypothetical protein n=1 Tax=Ruminococcus sp. TaxID=41978 RepID=UPI003FD82AB1